MVYVPQEGKSFDIRTDEQEKLLKLINGTLFEGQNKIEKEINALRTEAWKREEAQKKQRKERTETLQDIYTKLEIGRELQADVSSILQQEYKFAKEQVKDEIEREKEKQRRNEVFEKAKQEVEKENLSLTEKMTENLNELKEKGQESEKEKISLFNKILGGLNTLKEKTISLWDGLKSAFKQVVKWGIIIGGTFALINFAFESLKRLLSKALGLGPTKGHLAEVRTLARLQGAGPEGVMAAENKLKAEYAQTSQRWGDKFPILNTLQEIVVKLKDTIFNAEWWSEKGRQFSEAMQGIINFAKKATELVLMPAAGVISKIAGFFGTTSEDLAAAATTAELEQGPTFAWGGPGVERGDFETSALEREAYRAFEKKSNLSLETLRTLSKIELDNIKRAEERDKKLMNIFKKTLKVNVENAADIRTYISQPIVDSNRFNY